MNMNFAKFPAPVLGDETQELYTRLYGNAGEGFIEILNSSPDEVAVISRLIAYLYSCSKTFAEVKTFTN